jgi:hypothetical protein
MSVHKKISNDQRQELELLVIFLSVIRYLDNKTHRRGTVNLNKFEHSLGVISKRIEAAFEDGWKADKLNLLLNCLSAITNLTKRPAESHMVDLDKFNLLLSCLIDETESVLQGMEA